MIMDHFGLTNMEQLLRVVGDDFRYVELPYTGPELRTFPDGSMEGYWGERYKYAQFEGGKYLEPSYLPFAGIDKLEELDRSHFPSSDWFDYSTVRTQCEQIRDAATPSASERPGIWFHQQHRPGSRGTGAGAVRPD